MNDANIQFVFNLILIINFAAFVFAALRFKTQKSIFITTAATLVINLVVNLVDIKLAGLFEYSFVIYSWYPVFAILDFTTVILIWYFHRELKLETTMSAAVASVVFAISSGIHLARGLDRFVFSTDLMSFYSYVIPMLNGTLVTILFMTTIINLIFNGKSDEHNNEGNRLEGDVIWNDLAVRRFNAQYIENTELRARELLAIDEQLMQLGNKFTADTGK